MEPMKEILKAATTSVPPKEKLASAIQSAIGKLYEPTHIRKMADARAYEIAKIGQALRENSDILISYDKGNITADITAYDEFVKRTQHRLAFQELTKQRNIESVIGVAYSELDGQAAVPDEPVDPDWMISFFNSVEDVSNEQMQILWGKLLAGEIKRPNSFSRRTLNVLKNLTQKEAYVFQNISPFVLKFSDKVTEISNGCFLPHDLFYHDGLFDEYNINFDFSDILMLRETDLIFENDQTLAGSSIPPGEVEYVYGLNEKIEFSNSGKNEVQISYPVYILTKAGAELLTIISGANNSINLNKYMKDCLKYIMKTGTVKPEMEKQNIEIKIVPN